MKRITAWQLTPVFVGAICFAGIYSSVLPSRPANIKAQSALDSHRLSEPWQDPLMTNIRVLSEVKVAFANVTHFCANDSKEMSPILVLVEDFLLTYPLHLVVQTDAVIGVEDASITRTLKDTYYYGEDP